MHDLRFSRGVPPVKSAATRRDAPLISKVRVEGGRYETGGMYSRGCFIERDFMTSEAA